MARIALATGNPSLARRAAEVYLRDADREDSAALRDLVRNRLGLPLSVRKTRNGREVVIRCPGGPLHWPDGKALLDALDWDRRFHVPDMAHCSTMNDRGMLDAVVVMIRGRER